MFCLVETVCVCSKFFFWCWKPLLKLWGTNFKGKNFPVSGNHFLWFSCQKKQLFCIAETYFLTNVSFWVVETDFLAGTNHFLHIFFQKLLPEKTFFLSNGKEFLNKSLIPAIGEEFFSEMETVTLLERFFLLAETVTVMSGNQF